MTFGNWYRSKYPFIASEEEYARLNDAWESAFEAGQANPPDGWKLVPIVEGVKVVVDELYMRAKDLKKIQTTHGNDKE